MRGGMMRHHTRMHSSGNYVERTYELSEGNKVIGNLLIGYIDNSHLTESALIFKDTFQQLL